MTKPNRFTEGHIAQATGLSIDQIKQIRESSLYEKEHWIKSGREIVYTDEGKSKFLEWISKKFGAVRSIFTQDESDLKTAPSTLPNSSDAVATLKLNEAGVSFEQVNESFTEAIEYTSSQPVPLTVSNRCINPKLIIATANNGDLVRVRVRDNQNFQKGMKVNAKQIQADLYELVGRCPRFKGRW
jgi:hypothetical protein